MSCHVFPAAAVPSSFNRQDLNEIHNLFFEILSVKYITMGVLALILQHSHVNKCMGHFALARTMWAASGSMWKLNSAACTTFPTPNLEKKLILWFGGA